jgi:hypothetical protein
MATNDNLSREINALASGERLRHALARAIDEALADTQNRKRTRLIAVLNSAIALLPTPDATAPTITARQNLAAVNTIRITCSEGLDPDQVPAPAAFAIVPARAITDVEIQGASILLHYAGAKLVAGDSPTVAYTQPAATQIRVTDTAGLLLATSAATAVTVL